MDDKEHVANAEDSEQKPRLINEVKTSDLDAILGRKVSMKDHAGCYERTGVLMKDPLKKRYIVVVHARTPWDLSGSLFYLPLSLDKIVLMKISANGDQINLDTNIEYVTGVFGEKYKKHMRKIRKAVNYAK